MSEVAPQSGDGQAVKNSVAQMTAGAMLRQAREAQGLHIAAMAVALKVPVNKLEALEADRFESLPGAVFTRALAASICRTLKIDPKPILERLPQTSTPHLKTDESGINVAFRSSGSSSRLLSREQFSKPFVWVVLALLVGALILVIFPFAQRVELAGSSNAAADVVIAPLPVTAPAAIEVENPLTAIAPTPSSSDVVGAATPPATLPASAAATGIVVFKARGASWVEVLDANGVVQLRTTLTQGAVMGASGVTPLSVVVGRADLIDVRVRGQAFDAVHIAKDNVARFEVK
ncbi:MAG: RodZ domain-containing protein [Comamonadaceae bacterium]